MHMLKTAENRWFWWGTTVAYIVLTYATLGSMPAYWNGLNNAVAGHGLLVQYVLYSGAGAGLLIYLHTKRFLHDPLNLAVTCGVLLSFGVMFYLEKYPGEKIHMLQYGILGWLMYKSLSLHLDSASPRLYLTGAAVVMAAGALDEVIQALLPNRYFTVHDIFINGLSGTIVQLYIGYYVMRRDAAPAGV